MRFFILFLLALLGWTACQRAVVTTPTAAASDFLIQNVSVLPMNDSLVLSNQDVWVRGGYVAAVAPTGSLRLPKTLAVVDGQGQYLMPGLADMHVHLPTDSTEQQEFLLLHLMAGVTQLRSMRGQAQHVALRQALEAGEVLGPHLFLASQPIRKNLEMTPEEVDALIQRYKATGYDAVKVLSVADSATFSALATASKKHQLPLCGHIPSNIGLETTLESGTYTSIEHLGGYFALYRKGEAAFWKGIDQTVSRQVYNCATMDYYNTYSNDLSALRQRSGLSYIPERVKEWEAAYVEQTAEKDLAALKKRTKQNTQSRSNLIRILHRSGAALIVSPDATGLFAVPGFSMVRELELHEQAGISRTAVLQMGTKNAAEFIGDARRGTIAVGQAADFVLLGANPLENLKHLEQVEGVSIRGRWWTRARLEAALKRVQDEKAD